MRFLVLLATVAVSLAIPNPTLIPLQALALLTTSEEGLNTCPDRKSTCDNSDSTCCPTSNGYGCCPYKDGVCCSGGENCCPSGHVCDKSNGICQRKELWESVSMVKAECPDGGSCSSDETCCELISGGYGCCPQPNAVCCDDGKHCCPEGYSCDPNDDYCTKDGLMVLPKLTKRPATIPPLSKSDDVVCPDGRSSCSSSETCCKSERGGYACCPEPKAVCCDDDKCCPEGYTCDRNDDYCTRDGLMVSTTLKKPVGSPPTTWFDHVNTAGLL